MMKRGSSFSGRTSIRSLNGLQLAHKFTRPDPTVRLKSKYDFKFYLIFNFPPLASFFGFRSRALALGLIALEDLLMVVYSFWGFGCVVPTRPTGGLDVTAGILSGGEYLETVSVQLAFSLVVGFPAVPSGPMLPTRPIITST